MSEKIACYSVSESQSRQRQFNEKPHPYRSAFERDRDRIMHCSAFRMLEGKTQVFTPGINDHYRTRLTHSIEVAQVGRTIAKVLNLNENLTEAICLAHDLGHSPFGHSGESVLNKLMTDFGGFEHNCQSLRVVDLLEHPYSDFAGLNLMYETRLGLARHHSLYDKPAGNEFSEIRCSLEGQIADIADRIAYNCHDLEDGMRAGLLNEEKLNSLKLFSAAQEKINAEGIAEAGIRNIRTAKTIIDSLVSDCLNASKQALIQANISSLDQVYTAPEPLIVLSTKAETELTSLEEYLFDNMYMHDNLKQTAEKVEGWLTSLFEKFCQKPESLPQYYQALIISEGLERSVCDYTAGMTDRYCLTLLGEV